MNSRHSSPASTDTATPGLDTSDAIKISFRGGGDKIFLERLKSALSQRKWLLRGTVKPARDDSSAPSTPGTPKKSKAAGIAALEQRGLDMRKNNELMIGDAFEDLESLMASAKGIVALAEQFARQVNNGTESREAT